MLGKATGSIRRASSVPRLRFSDIGASLSVNTPHHALRNDTANDTANDAVTGIPARPST